jgi:hypothetical protein
VISSVNSSPQGFRDPNQSRFKDRQLTGTTRFVDSKTGRALKTQEPKKNDKVIEDIAQYSISFESARVESTQVLDNLSFRLKTEMANINFRMDNFRTNMARVLSNEMRTLR